MHDAVVDPAHATTPPQAGSQAAPAAAIVPGSISFAIFTTAEGDRILPLLAKLDLARHDGDEVLVVMREEAAHTFSSRPPWVRVVTVADASIFRLRAQIPTVCRNEWIVVLEDHSMIEPMSVDAIRRLVRERPQIDMIPFLTKNLTSTRPWDWAIFLFNFALVWAPLDHAPPFSIVTSGIVRRAALKTTAAFKDGEWELQVVPGLFAAGNHAYSNDIFIDHIKPLNMVPALALIFHNARAGASLQRSLGIPARNVRREGYFAFGPRPRLLMEQVAARRQELPAGTRLRLHVLGFMHLIGNLAGLLFRGGRSAHKLD